MHGYVESVTSLMRHTVLVTAVSDVSLMVPFQKWLRMLATDSCDTSPAAGADLVI